MEWDGADDPFAFDDEDDAYRGRPRWVYVVTVVLLVTFVGWAINSVISRV